MYSLSLYLSDFVFPEANPEKFNSRFRNKMFYAGVSVPLDVLPHAHWNFLWLPAALSVCL